MKRTKTMIYKETEEARELYLFTDNCGIVFERRLRGILDLLIKYYNKGVYSHEKAIDALYPALCDASNLYILWYGYGFSVQDRFSAAVMLEKDFFENYIEK